mgnify:CR=1 FL=1
MAISISGTNGISGVNGSASAPALQGTDADTGIVFGSDTASISTAGTERLVVGANGLDLNGNYVSNVVAMSGMISTAQRVITSQKLLAAIPHLRFQMCLHPERFLSHLS